MSEEKFFKPKSKEEILDEAITFLDDAMFNFACFVSAFKRSLNKEDDRKQKTNKEHWNNWKVRRS